MAEGGPASVSAGAGYVRLKHTLADIGLRAVAHSGTRTAAALAAYATASRRGDAVPLGSVAARAGTTPAAARRMLRSTGLFAIGDRGRATVGLAPLFLPVAPYFYRQVRRLGVARRRLARPRPAGVPREIWRAAALFNAGLFFECHEYLEDVWRAAAEPGRTFYHGLVQAAAGCYHFEKGNLHGAATLAGKASEKLRPYAPEYRGLDVAALLAGLGAMLGPSGGGEPPVMRFLRRARPAPRRPGPQEPRGAAGMVM